jgi:hypothetical protein
MAIKKAYVQIVEFLEANKDSKVKTILDGVIELASAKSGGGGRTSDNVLRDGDNNVVAIFCYYHKQYEPIADVEYGKKATSSTGLNSMCKEGTSRWTTQQRAAKKANEELLIQVQNGEVAPEDIATAREDIDKAKATIIAREDGIGYPDLESATKALL